MSDEYKIIQTSYAVSLYTDWSPVLDLIPNIHEKTILELGLGLGTRILLDKFKFVHSFEVVNTDEWYKKSLNDYKNDTNWSSQFYFMKDFGLDISDSELLTSEGKVRNLIPLQEYFKKLEEFIPIMNKIDVAFVDQGFHFRGESVNYFLEKEIPYILAHDTHNHDQIYGYDKINIPNNYIKETSTGLGTTIFIKK